MAAAGEPNLAILECCERRDAFVEANFAGRKACRAASIRRSSTRSRRSSARFSNLDDLISSPREHIGDPHLTEYSSQAACGHELGRSRRNGLRKDRLSLHPNGLRQGTSRFEISLGNCYLAASTLIVDIANLVSFWSVCFSSSKVVCRSFAPSSSPSSSA